MNYLQQPEYIHALLNPLPIYGLATALLGYVIALLLRSRSARVTTLALIALTALSAWPVEHFGEEGYDRVLSMSDSVGEKWLKEHMERAERYLAIFYVLAAGAAAGIVAEFKFSRAAIPIGVLTLLLGAGTLAVGAHIARAGGQVRHKEFRTSGPPPESAAGHKHAH